MKSVLILCLWAMSAGLPASLQAAWNPERVPATLRSTPAQVHEHYPAWWKNLATKSSPPPRLVGPLAVLAEDFVWLYQKTLSGRGQGSCPHFPSCSRYSRLALEEAGFLGGSILTASRLLRCHSHTQTENPERFQLIEGSWLLWNPPAEDQWWR